MTQVNPIFIASSVLIRQQTAVINSIRAYLAEFGIVARVGRSGIEDLLDVIADPSDGRVPELAGALWLPASRAQENAVIPPRGIEVVDLQCRPVELALKLAHRLRIHLLIDLDRK